MEKILEVNNLTKIYKNGRGVKNINFEVYKGEVFGFLGPNGAGKTTIMKAIVGLNTIQTGTVSIFGTNLHENFEEAIKHVGSIIETADLYLYMTAYNNLKIASRFYKSISETDIDEILDVVKIKEYKNEKVRNFSLGMKQRLALAIALLSKPKFVILDEPTNGLDIEGTIEMRNLIIKLAKEQQITFFISSHLVHEIELMCSRVAIIHYGELVNNGKEISEIKKEVNSLEEFYMSSIKKEVLK
ncbi:ABC transporter ATP-binding protein [Gottfriedia sp. NPDC057991]|uniref:ABC transporter ATP-binding protein n=1 Tax=Gottfriedia sp. NPDC057991 TaxID=3346298 RepID=UPI0036D88DC6